MDKAPKAMGVFCFGVKLWQTCGLSGWKRRKRASSANTTTRYRHVASVRFARISGGGSVTCNKDTTDLDCLDCPYGYDDDEAVYCGVGNEKSVQVLR